MEKPTHHTHLEIRAGARITGRNTDEGTAMHDLAGKVALVTGASAPRGIGRAVAERLARSGAHVVVSDLGGEGVEDGGSVSRETRLANVVDAIAAAGGSAEPATLDVSDLAAIETVVGALTSRFGGVDVLVNNAGSLAGACAFLEATPAQWQASFAVNLLGPVALARAVIPHMQAAGWGRIVNIGSTGSLGAEPGFGAYTAMKHALVGFSKTLAAEFGRDGIRCNTVCPGFIDTDMHAAANARLARETGASLEAVKAARYRAVATGDAGTPEDVAEAVAFLVSPAAQYITGVNLPVSGGVPFGI
ncbi:MAG: SDR family oxidoreductase [Pseudomonadota bacterium]